MPTNPRRDPLPRPRDAFFGRHELLRELEEILRGGARLVTLLGPGGIGKTRAALELATRVADDERERGDGVFFCDLSNLHHADEIVDALSRALTLDLARAPRPTKDATTDAVDEAGRALARAGRVLVVVDTFEQLVAGGAEIIDRLLDHAPEARFVVTSRRRLRLADETVIELEALALPREGDAAETVGRAESVQLFLARASRVRRGVRKDFDLESIAALVRRLEGIPLAIEVCAARAAILSPRQILAELSEDPRRLDAPDGRRPKRQATLHDAIAWSFELLAPEEREALARLSVFRGGFDLAAFEAVHVGPRSAVDLVATLHDCSLVRAAPEPRLDDDVRYGLFDSIRSFAAEQLDALGKTAETEGAHARHYARLGDELARTLQRRDDRLAWARLSMETENLLAAHERTFESDPATSARAALALEHPLGQSGRYDFAIRLARRAVEAAERVGEPLSSARARRMRGEILRRHDIPAAIEDLRAAAAESEALNAEANGEDTMLCLRFLGVALREHGRLDEALAVLLRAAELSGGRGAPRAEANVHIELCAVRRRQGALVEALAHSEIALATARAANDVLLEGRALMTLGIAADERGELERARTTFEEALDLLRAAGDRRYETIALDALGRMNLELGRIPDARGCFEEASFICDELGLRGPGAGINGNLAWADFFEGDHEGAAARLRRTTEEMRAIGYGVLIPPFLAALGAAEAMRGDLEAAERAFEGAERADIASPAQRLLTATLRGFLDLARARRAESPDAAVAHRADAERRLRSALDAAPALRNGPVRTLGRWLEDALRGVPASRRSVALRVDAERHRVEVDGAVVDLSARTNLWRLIDALARAPKPLDADALFAAAWPDERIGKSSARNRLHVALSTLRKMGLAAVIRSGDEGYYLAR